MKYDSILIDPDIAQWFADEFCSVYHDLLLLNDEWTELDSRVRALRDLLDVCDGPPIDMAAVRRCARRMVPMCRHRSRDPGPVVPECLQPLHDRLLRLADERDFNSEEVSVLRQVARLLNALLVVVIQHGRYPPILFDRLKR